MYDSHFHYIKQLPKKKSTYPKDNNPMDPKLEKKVPSVYHSTLQLLHMSDE